MAAKQAVTRVSNPGRRRTRRTSRRLTESTRLFWNRQASALFAHAESVWEQAAEFDTAVRDSIAEGLAYIVQAAFDCQANAMKFPDTDSWMAFIDTGTAAWFRERGFAEWFCGAAATLFRTTPPRTNVNITFFKPTKKGKS